MAQAAATLTLEQAPPAVRVDAIGLRCVARRAGREITLLHDVSVSIMPGELVAIVGGSGAGKTTLLNTLAGVRIPSAGTVLYNGRDLHANLGYYRSHLGYVPQDDIVHTELTVERTLAYAARLRLPPDTPREERDRDIAEVMEALGLASQAHQRVASLSGGQRKRTSIGAELLTRPGVFFLDEPTSGLDPATGRDMMRLLRGLAHGGSTIVLTTHAPQDVGMCDRVVFLARGGYVAFAGTPPEALKYFGVEQFDEIYERIETADTAEGWAERFRRSQPESAMPGVADFPVEPGAGFEAEAATSARRQAGQLRQWLILTERNFEILTRNMLTLAILAGAPVLVIAMMAVLFRPGAFDFADPSPSAAIMILYWVAFGGFFFGLTYGLLQICTEFPIFFRERLVNLKVLPYVLSKLAVLTPVLLVVVVLMLAVLRVFDRLPGGGIDLYGELGATLMLDGLAAIALGLLASAAVSRPEQATLVLPMLCFPQVLFSGAILPVPIMAGAGKVISFLMSDRWAFEALGKSVDMENLLANGGSPLGPPLLAQYEDTFSNPLGEAWLAMSIFTAVFLVLTCWVLAKKSTAFR